MTRAPLFLSWIQYHGRSDALASALGLDTRFIALGRQGQKWLAPLRYAGQALVSVGLLIRRRPQVLLVMAPPTTLVAIALVWRLLWGCVVVVDAHTGAVIGRRGRMKSSFVWAARRADLVIITNEPLSEMLAERGVRSFVLHDAPTLVEIDDADRSRRRRQSRFRCLYPASWASDEPYEIVLQAAPLLPSVDFLITGRPPAAVVKGQRELPKNVHLVGFLDRDDYLTHLADADVVLALTTREQTMQQAGYEALAAGRPLVASDTTVLRSYFTRGAVFSAPTVEGLVAALTEVQAHAGHLASEMRELQSEKRAEFTASIAALRTRVGLRGIAE